MPALCVQKPSCNAKHPVSIRYHLFLLRLGLDLATKLDTLQNVLTVLVELQFGDDDLRWVNAEGDGLARGLLLDDTLDVDDVLETVDGGDLALTTLVGATNNKDLIVLSNGDGTDLGRVRMCYRCAKRTTNVVLFAELLAQRCAHDGTSNTGWGIVMSLA